MSNSICRVSRTYISPRVLTVFHTSPLTLRQYSCLTKRPHSSFPCFHYGSTPFIKSARCFTVSAFSNFWHEMFLRIARAPPAVFISDQLCYVHDTTGLEWWAVIILSSVAMRCCLMLPAHVTSQKVAAKRRIVFERMDKEVIPSLRAATNRHVHENKWSKEQAKFHFQRVAGQLKRDAIIQHNCALSKLYLPFFIQIPIWISLSVTLRNLATMMAASPGDMGAQLRVIQMASEGCLWMPNLAVPDQTWILPFLVGSAFLLNTEVSLNRHAKDLVPKSKTFYIIPYLMRFIAISMIPVTAFVPSAVALYWASSGFAGLAVNLTLMSPKVRDFVRIPNLPDYPEKPYRQVVENMQDKSTWLVRKILGKS